MLVEVEHHLTHEQSALRLLVCDLAEQAAQAQEGVQVLQEAAELAALVLRLTRGAGPHGEEKELLQEEGHLLRYEHQLPVVLLDARQHRLLRVRVALRMRQPRHLLGDHRACLRVTARVSAHRVVAVQRVVRVGDHRRGGQVAAERRGVVTGAVGAFAVAELVEQRDVEVAVVVLLRRARLAEGEDALE